MKQDTSVDVDEDGKPADKEPRDLMMVDVDNETVASGLHDGTVGAAADDETDPLDAFMNGST